MEWVRAPARTHSADARESSRPSKAVPSGPEAGMHIPVEMRRGLLDAGR